MSDRPFFSILLPTRNRSDMLVEWALRSVLNNSFENFEIVVCDNASTDDTEERVREIKDPRVRYVRSSEWIPKEHFFEFAFRQAHGEFSMIFCDDDYLTSTALEKAYRVLSAYRTDMLVYPPSCTYFFTDWYEPSRRNVLIIPPFSGKLFRVDAGTHLRMILERMALLVESPMVTDVFYRTSFINSLIDKYGTIFPHGHMGDYNISCYTLSHTPYYLFLEEPLTVFGHWKSNTSEQLHFFNTTMPEYREWISWITEKYLVKMPVKAYLWQNCVAAALQDMKERLNLPWDISMARYFHSLIEEIVFLEIRGVDVKTQKEECYRTFFSLPGHIQAEIAKAIGGGIEYSTTNVIEVLDMGSQGISFASVDQWRRVDGNEYGFSNIFEAGKLYEDFINNRVDIKPVSQERVSGEDRLKNFIEGLSLLSRQFNRIFIIGDNNSITRTSVELLGNKVAGAGNFHFLMKGAEIVPGLSVHDLDDVAHVEFECAVMTSPDSPLADDAPHKMFSNYIKHRLEKAKGREIVLFKFEDILHIGSFVSMVKNGNLSIRSLIEAITEDGEEAAEKGDTDRAYTIISSLLETVDKTKEILLNDLAVIHFQKGDIEKAESILQKVCEEYDAGEARRNLETLNRLKTPMMQENT